MKIFLSWSGRVSKKVAGHLKKSLIDLYPDENLTIFMSDEDIESGTEWYSKIKKELNTSDFAILCLTKENINAPWINFEAGAIAIGEPGRKTICLLIDLQTQEIETPIKHYQLNKINKQSIRKMVLEIKNQGDFKNPNDNHFDVIYDDFYKILKKNIDDELKDYKASYTSNEFVIFPKDIKSVKNGKVFIGSPMASIKDKEYEALRKDILSLKKCIIENCDVSEVYYPGENIENEDQFDGKHKAIKKDFKILKESEYYIFIYPKKIPSSILLEMGYAIALSKNTIIYTKKRDKLPFMLQCADQAINTLRIYEYKSIEDIIDAVRKNAETFFEKRNS